MTQEELETRVDDLSKGIMEAISTLTILHTQVRFLGTHIKGKLITVNSKALPWLVRPKEPKDV